MNKSIWHIVEETPEEDRVIVVKSKRTGEYLVGSEFEFILDNFTKWAYFDDLLALETENKDLSDKIGKLETELERTRKALEIAVDTLKYIRRTSPLSFHFEAIEKALEQITALEQNKSAFVHNKIEFPEFNDNLLEEFDKQFFENGQDDDLTETALEQKE